MTISRFSPVIRTNPVTGWKALYGAANGIRDGAVDDLAPHESDLLKKYCMSPKSHVLLRTHFMTRRLLYPALSLFTYTLLRTLVQDMITSSSDLQIRRRWKGVNGVALWDKYRHPSFRNSSNTLLSTQTVRTDRALLET
jgi:hypothetical protein